MFICWVRIEGKGPQIPLIGWSADLEQGVVVQNGCFIKVSRHLLVFSGWPPD